MGALDGGHLDLHEQLGPGQSGDAATQGGGAALREPRRALTVRPILLGAIHGEGAPPHDVVQRGAGLAERPPDGLVGQVVLGRPVARRLHRSGGGQGRAAAHVDEVADLDRAGVAARLLAHMLGVDVPPRPGSAEHGLGLDLDQHLRAEQAGDSQERRGGAHVAERLEPRPGVVGGPAAVLKRGQEAGGAGRPAALQ